MATNEILSDDERRDENKAAVRELRNLTRDGRATLRALDSRLAFAYWVLVGLSILTFCVGVALIGVSVYEALRGNTNETQSAISGGLGVADLAALFLFRPVERIHSLMGDMSQMAMAISSYQAETNLRLIAMNVNDSDTVKAAADDIRRTTESSVRLVQDYFESKRRR